jgi:hypothetical protein
MTWLTLFVRLLRRNDGTRTRSATIIRCDEQKYHRNNQEAIKSSDDQPSLSIGSLRMTLQVNNRCGLFQAALEGTDQEILDWLEDERKTLMVIYQ